MTPAPLPDPTVFPAPTIIVHDLVQAKAALSTAAARGRRVVLCCPATTAAATGPGIFAETIALARSGFEQALAGALFDCGDEAGLALAAIRRGGLDIAIDLPAGPAAKIRDMAAKAGVRVVDARDSAALDLADADATRATQLTIALLETPPR